MHHVERAVIMAAGTGSRMKPVTLETPKPLVKVNGVRMIDTVIGALHKNGIREIYVVVGYMKEQFAGLEAQYEGLTLVENPDYDRYNNISSLYVVRGHLENAIILDADQIVVLDNGKMVGIGKHYDLVRNCPVYQEIALSQLSKEELGL